MRTLFTAVLASLVIGTANPIAQTGPPDAAQAGYDVLLDTYVRDGLVYYRALRADRSKLDGFLAGVGSASIDGASRSDAIAFWLNAYNAFVLRTVIDHYPIAQRTREYPARSIRQIPGAFERTPRRIAGRSLTLDQIEQTILPTFRDPRLFLALGRGAVGGGRLRSEAFTGANLERQLVDVASECVRRAQCVDLDRGANSVKISSIFSWRERDFTEAFADKANGAFSNRSPMERAVLAFMAPTLLTTEREFIDGNQFQVRFIPFDWSLNELSTH